MKHFFLRKSRKILRQSYKTFQKKRARLSEAEQKRFEDKLKLLDEKVLLKDREGASCAAKEIAELSKHHFPKTMFDQLKELFFALLFAVVVAFCIRQFWFELYEVPTGSMRPTVLEKDRMVVSKTTFGINPPFINTLWLYKPEYLKRGGIIVFTVEDLDIQDSDMLYFGIFPGKKRYVKRAMGKPGDTLYFYGGRVYGVDARGTPFTELADPEWLEKSRIASINHVPYITMDGKQELSQPLSRGMFAKSKLKQMNTPIGTLTLKEGGAIEGRFFNGKEWIKDSPNALKSAHSTPQSYSDLWGIKNFAMARLLTKEQVTKFYGAPKQSSALYLELRHTPNLTYPLPTMRQTESGKLAPMITPFATTIPLDHQHLERLREALYTIRFVVEDGHAFRYQENGKHSPYPQFDPLLTGVPNGTYEFYDGIGYKVHIGGIRTKLSSSHPLNAKEPQLLQTLFNLGTGMNIVYAPQAANQPYNPQRFAFYRDGALFVMNAPIFEKEDANLQAFIKEEIEKQKTSSTSAPYIAFIDHGAPTKDGKVDVEFIEAFGLKIDGALALGDNYASSADSRDFGAVPVGNLRGSPSFTFWPPSQRVGPLPEPKRSWLTLPNVLVWSVAILIIAAASFYARKKNQRSLFKDEESSQ